MANYLIHYATSNNDRGMSNYLIHFGRSKEDGAPGPGTGNYPRDGSGSAKVEYKASKLEKKAAEYQRKAAELKRKSTRWFMPIDSEKANRKAAKYEAKASRYSERASKIRAKEAKAEYKEAKANYRLKIKADKLDNQKTKDAIKKMGASPIDLNTKRIREDKEYREHLKKVADYGLKALARMDRPSAFDEDDLNNADKESKNAYREWFLWEDQTIGYGQIGHWMTSGYNADQVHEMIEWANDIPYESRDDVSNKHGIDKEIIFEMQEGQDLDAFTDAFKQVIDEEKKK